MQNCEVCGGKKWFSHIDRQTGLQRKHHITTADGTEYDLRIWRCWRCGHVQEEESPFIPMGYRSAANILYFDLEVSKSMLFNYGLKVPSKYINPDDLIHEYYIICWAASYVGSDKVYSSCVTSEQALAWNDKEILSQLRDLIDSADIIAGHNVDAFDIRKLNTRLLLNGLQPVTGKKSLDTLKIARQKFAFESNRLDYISQKLGLRPKDDIRNKDWLEIVTNGSERTLKKVMKYCKGDVKNGKGILEQIMRFSGKRADYGTMKLTDLYMRGTR